MRLLLDITSLNSMWCASLTAVLAIALGSLPLRASCSVLGVGPGSTQRPSTSHFYPSPHLCQIDARFICRHKRTGSVEWLPACVQVNKRTMISVCASQDCHCRQPLFQMGEQETLLVAAVLAACRARLLSKSLLTQPAATHSSNYSQLFKFILYRGFKSLHQLWQFMRADVAHPLELTSVHHSNYSLNSMLLFPLILQPLNIHCFHWVLFSLLFTQLLPAGLVPGFFFPEHPRVFTAPALPHKRQAPYCARERWAVKLHLVLLTQELTRCSLLFELPGIPMVFKQMSLGYLRRINCALKPWRWREGNLLM